MILFKKMVLIGLVQKYFLENLKTQKFPSYVITVRKEDLLDVKELFFNYDVIGVNLNAESINLCNLERLSKISFIYLMVFFSKMTIIFSFKYWEQ